MDTIFHALADPTRRSLLDRLQDGSALSVTELAEPVAMTRQAVTRHLDLLEEAGLVRCHREGRRRLHTLVPEALLPLDEWLAPYAELWDQRLQRLRKHLGESDVTRPHPEETP